MVTEASKGRPTHPSGAEQARRRMQARKRPDKDAEDVTEGAAAAERASAGMGTEDADPASWLFGDSVGEEHSG